MGFKYASYVLWEIGYPEKVYYYLGSCLETDPRCKPQELGQSGRLVTLVR